MKKFIYISVLIITLSCSAIKTYSQTNLNNISLVTWEYVPNKGVISDDPKLVKYSFTNGQLSKREEIYKVGSSTPRHFDGKSSILNDRYIISWYGDIFDIKNEKLLFTQIGFDFSVEILNDRIIYKHEPYSDFFDKEDSIKHSRIKSLYYYFDLETEKIIEYNIGTQYRVEGELSKNKQLGLEFIEESGYFHQIDSLKPKQIIVYKTGRLVLNKFESTPTTIIDSLSVGINIYSSFIQRLPILWLDNENFLTQTRNGELILANTSSDIKSFPVLTDLKNELRPPSLYINSDGQIIYNCPTFQSNEYIVDIDNMKLIEVSDANNIGGNFSIDWEEPMKVKFNNVQIFSDSSMTTQFSVYKDLIATQTFEDCKTDRWKCNTFIKIYNSSGHLIESIQTRYIHSIIGWIEN